MALSREWARRYPPVTGFAVAAVLAALVLPSSLNVPQTNPSETVEFAPVPPTDDDAPPPAGNTGSLGLGSSSGISGDAEGGDAGLPPPPPPPVGDGTVPRTKRCVGNPPRQTEDPLSPPCVAHFEGDNFGATHVGVSRREVTVLFYVDGTISFNSDTGEDNEAEFEGQYFDLAKPPPPDGEPVTLRNLRRLQRYFNDRYQTYGRFVHFWVYFARNLSDGVSTYYTPETRQQDAADNYRRLKPFAVLTSGIKYGLDDVYSNAMAQKGVLVFGSGGGSRPQAFYRRYPGYVWSYLPTIETQAALFGSFVCRNVVGQPVVDSGIPGANGKPRVLGFLETTDRTHPELIAFAQLVKKMVRRCGGRFAVEATFPRAGRTYQSSNPSDPAGAYATENVARFKAANVTTVIWAGGYETDHSKAAGQADYRPEWLLAGDTLSEGNINSRLQDPSVWEHAWMVTQVVRVEGGETDSCPRALREADPTIGKNDQDRFCGQQFYVDTRQLFNGIQVAGPRLQPRTIDQGFHAIPRVASSDPKVPGCFYGPGDYTCVKDATLEWWDPGNRARGYANTGCYRMVEGGRRYLPETWPAGNLNRRQKADDPCNQYNKAALLF